MPFAFSLSCVRVQNSIRIKRVWPRHQNGKLNALAIAFQLCEVKNQHALQVETTSKLNYMNEWAEWERKRKTTGANAQAKRVHWSNTATKEKCGKNSMHTRSIDIIHSATTTTTKNRFAFTLWWYCESTIHMSMYARGRERESEKTERERERARAIECECIMRSRNMLLFFIVHFALITIRHCRRCCHSRRSFIHLLL